MKMYEVRLRFHWNLLRKLDQQYSSIGWDNGMAPSRRQAIVWNNGGWFTDTYMLHLASKHQRQNTAE